MEVQQNPEKRYTVGALLLHAIVLLGFACFAYIESLTISYPLTAGLANLTAGFYVALGVIAVWLTGEHSSETVGNRRLQIWAGFCIVLSLYPVMAFLAYPFYFHLNHIIKWSIFLLPPMLILVFVGNERT